MSIETDEQYSRIDLDGASGNEFSPINTSEGNKITLRLPDNDGFCVNDNFTQLIHLTVTLKIEGR